MSLEILVHGKIASSLPLARLQLQDFKESLVSSASNVALILVPPDNFEWGVVWHADLQSQYKTVGSTFLLK